MAAVSTQLAGVCRLSPLNCLPAVEAQFRTKFLGGEILGYRSLIFRRGIAVSASSRELKNAAAEELKLGEDSTGADGETKMPQESAADGGLVETWFYGSYKAWPDVHRLLTERDVNGVECQEAFDLSNSGAAILIDVREPQEFEKRHAQGSFGAPLFQLIQGNDLQANLRRLGYALLTDFSGTERNPNFIDQARQAVDGDKQKPVIVMCGIGGTLSTFVERTGPKAKKFADPARRFGRASRSLRAVFELQEAGFTNVSYLSGGLSTWVYLGLPTEGGK
ncbi:unnamed protein product [Calypogeia fissa]